MTTNDRIILTAVRAADGGAKLLLEVTTGSARALKTIFAVRLSHLPHVGEIDAVEWAYYCREDEICRATEIGLRVLGVGAVSGLMLLQKMRQKGISSEAARIAVEELVARGYLDESAGAVREVEKGLSKYWGNRRILAHVSAKGYGKTAIEAATDRLRCEDESERLLKLLARRHVKIPQTDRDITKVVTSLVRFGYAVNDIKRALSQICH